MANPHGVYNRTLVFGSRNGNATRFWTFNEVTLFSPMLCPSKFPDKILTEILLGVLLASEVLRTSMLSD